MRFIIHGVGAVGSTTAAALVRAGEEVVGIARGRQLEAIRTNGLLLRTPGSSDRVRFDCVSTPSDIAIRPDDAILLAVKTQDTEAALSQLAAAGVRNQPIFCMQNGIENERMALRRFANVHAVTLLTPAEFVTPGEVAVFAEPKMGIFTTGRYPGGADAADEGLAKALSAGGIAGLVSEDVMASKRGKLLVNLINIVEAAMGADAPAEDVVALLMAEGQAVFEAAGIAWSDVGEENPLRKELLHITPVPGVARAGNSTAQSLARHTGSVETDYLNGEIVLMGRLHDVPTPANAYFCDLATEMAAGRRQAGSLRRDEVAKALNLSR